MAIVVNTSEDLQRLLTTLANELVDANVYLRLHGDLGLAVSMFSREFNQARAFWGLTLQAHQDAAIFRLCKIYDQRRDSVNLKSLLETIKANQHFFSEPNFRSRLQGNPAVDSLALESRVPDPIQLSADISYVSKATNPKVKTLVELRNALYAHRASKDVLNATDLAASYPLTTADAHDLLACGMEIVNRYCQLFHAHTYSTQVIGHSDYKTVIEALRWDLARRDDEIQRASIRADIVSAWDEVEKRKLRANDETES